MGVYKGTKWVVAELWFPFRGSSEQPPAQAAVQKSGSFKKQRPDYRPKKENGIIDRRTPQFMETTISDEPEWHGSYVRTRPVDASKPRDLGFRRVPNRPWA